MAKTLVLLSGGVDSATLVASLARSDAAVAALFVRYGQSAVREEAVASQAVADFYGVRLETVTLEGPTFGDGEIRGRNAFLVHTALLLTPTLSSVLTIGIHAGVDYVDCAPPFVDLMNRSLDLHSGGEVTLAAPFIDHSKADVFALAKALEVPVELTYSCESGGGPCGTCLSCMDRTKLDALS